MSNKTDTATLVSYCNDLLEVAGVEDYCPNGLQVAGKDSISKLISGVTACQELIERAIEGGADALLVHHGYFWRGEDPCLVGMKRRRVRLLMEHDINLIVYHLPLDISRKYSNNTHLGSLFGIDTTADSVQYLDPHLRIGFVADLPAATTPQELEKLLHDKLARQPLHLSGGQSKIKRLAWCSGAGQKFIEQAAALGADCYLSGEVSENTFHSARELGIDYFAIGHHNSEVGGVQLLAEELVRKFKLQHKFIDIPNPV